MAIGSTFGSRGFLGGRWRTACLWRTATRRYLSTTHRSPLHVRQHAGGDQGFVAFLVEITELVHQQALKQLQNHKLGTDINIQIGASIRNSATNDFRAERHLIVREIQLWNKMANPGRQHPYRLLVSIPQAIGQVIYRYLLFKIRVIHQAEGVLVHFFQ